jgi:hypothetical protein
MHLGAPGRDRAVVADHASREGGQDHSAKVITHARYTVFQMAKVAVPRDLFRRILDLIDDLLPTQMAQC